MDKIKKRALKLAKKKVAFVGSVYENDKPGIKAMKSVYEEGKPDIKAMKVVKHNGLETFYFVSNHSEIKAQHYKRNFNACVYFPGGLVYKELILDGIMKVFHGDEIKGFIKKKNDRNGETNPDCCVLQFITRKGRLHHWSKTEVFEID